jgi:magnesium chelatase subunit D
VHRFPFTAIVGQERLKQALLVNAVNPAVGGLLVSGPTGTAKSTAVRGLLDLLGDIEVVAGCPFGCDPAAPECSICTGRAAGGAPLPALSRRRPLVTLPLNATEDRVAGSLDVARALNEGVLALAPGLLAEANRGILYVDEINLLDDHLGDILLDAAAMGVNVVEREGISVEHPAHFLLVGTMNPEEGDLRPQIADRIGLRVDVAALTDPRERGEVLRRREAFTADPAAFAASHAGAQDDLRARIGDAQHRVAEVRVPDPLYAAIGAMVTRLGVTSHRGDVTVLECAKALTALEGRDEVAAADVRAAATLALDHRRSADPLQPVPPLTHEEVEHALEAALELGDEIPKARARPAPRVPAQGARP